jgi:hypothetical protein
LDRVAIGKRKQPSSLSRIGELFGHFYGLTILILSLFQTWLGSYLFSSWSITTEQPHLRLVFCEIVYSPQENTQASLLVPSCWCRPGPQCQGLLFSSTIYSLALKMTSWICVGSEFGGSKNGCNGTSQWVIVGDQRMDVGVLVTWLEKVAWAWELSRGRNPFHGHYYFL